MKCYYCSNPESVGFLYTKPICQDCWKIRHRHLRVMKQGKLFLQKTLRRIERRLKK
jgi:hypothetical protein